MTKEEREQTELTALIVRSVRNQPHDRTRLSSLIARVTRRSFGDDPMGDHHGRNV